MAVVSPRVNGATDEVDVDPATPRLYVLRNDLNLRGLRIAAAVGILALACAAAPAAWAESGESSGAPSKSFTAPRTSFGHPDLSGTWTNNNATPLQRPAQWADKEFLTDAELAAVQRTARQVEEDGDRTVLGDQAFIDAIAGDEERSRATPRPATNAEVLAAAG